MMGIRHNFTVICEQVIADKTDRLSLINIVRNFIVPTLPATIPKLCIATSFSGGEGHRFSLALVGPRRKELLRSPEEDVPPASAAREGDPRDLVDTHAALTVLQAVFPEEGVYSVVLRVDGRVIHRERFGVVVKHDAAERERGV